jgi:hypothetical protein
MNRAEVPGRGLLIVTCIIMLVSALPLSLWTFNIVHVAVPFDVPGDDWAAIGCIVGAATYLWSILPAVLGLLYSNKAYRYKRCRVLGWLTAALLLACVVMQRGFFLITTLPLAVLTALYLIAAYAPKRRKDRES